MILGATKHSDHQHIDPYMVMRAGVIPGVLPSGRNLRAGIRNASARVHASFPFQTAPLPAPLPVASPAAVPVAPATSAKGTAGAFGGFGFGSPGGVRAGGMDPYMVMRAGVVPGIMPNASNLRAGVRNAAGYVQSSFPFQTAALPAPLPPATPTTVPVTAATPVATPSGTKGLMGVLADHLGFGPPRRRRHWFFNPLTITADRPSSCEKLGPRSDGLFVTICNGQVTEYSDAAGNVRANPYAMPGYGA